MSQHLKVLKDVGLLNERREGTRLLSVRAEGSKTCSRFLPRCCRAVWSG